jgi:HSP20 family molecular chaperone IbpA
MSIVQDEYRISSPFDPFSTQWNQFLNQWRQCSSYWLSDADKTPIVAITTRQTPADILFKLDIPEIDQILLDVKVTPKMITIRGTWRPSAGVEGFFHPRGFEALIPLSTAVRPETVLAEVQPQGLSILLSKQTEPQPFATAQFAISIHSNMIPYSS